MNKRKIFEVEMIRLNPFGANTYTEIALPATPYELANVLEQIHITDDPIHSLEIVNSELEFLPQFISENVNLYELNHLASRLSELYQWELDCFEGMVMMGAAQSQYEPIAIERLINMTYSVEHCQIAYEAYDNASLGRFYANNGFVPELEALPEKIFQWLDYAKIGKEMRENESGVFTPNGYVVQDGEIVHKYQSSDAIPTEKLDYAILLRVKKSYFDDTEYDNDLIAFLKLPASDIYHCLFSLRQCRPCNQIKILLP